MVRPACRCFVSFPHRDRGFHFRFSRGENLLNLELLFDLGNVIKKKSIEFGAGMGLTFDSGSFME